MSLPRAVITGYGCLSPLGDNAATTWEGMKAGKNGIGPIQNTPLYDLRATIAGQVRKDLTGIVEKRRLSMYDRFSLLAIAAARDALEHSGLEITEELAPRIGTVLGVGNCGWEAVEEGFRRTLVEGKKRAKIFAVPRAMPCAPACNISMQLGLKGPVFGVTSACSSSNHAISSGLQMIRSGQADVVFTGGSEAPIIFGVLKAWEAIRILAPEVCQPFDLNRKGLLLAEGAGVIVLETLEHARARGATIHAELAGAGSSADAGDLVIPTPQGPIAAIRMCLKDAGLNPEDVDYINAHGTGTKANDSTETGVIRTVFGAHADKLSVSSTKSMHGHALGASGAIEIIACLGALREDVVPPTINYNEPDPECDLDVTPNKARERPVRVAISNAFAFGGLNAVIALKKFEG